MKVRSRTNPAVCRKQAGLLHVLLIAIFSCVILPLHAAIEYECQSTPSGIPRKVIVKAQNAKAFINPDFTGEAQDLKFFRKYFVFKESGKGFQVGDATVRTSIIGWVAREAVLPWNTEQAIFLVNKQSAGRLPVRIWQVKDDVGRPNMPAFEEELSGSHTTEPFPILAKENNLVKVAFLWDAKGPAASLTTNLAEGSAALARGAQMERDATGKKMSGAEKQREKLAKEVRQMDVVLVMDVTGSMGAYMKGVQENIIRIVNSLSTMSQSGSEVKVRVGVVAYRDYIDESITGITETCDLTTDIAKVVKFVSNIKPGGGGYRNEAVFEGLYQAAVGVEWGEHSSRYVCLVGDAPPHTPDDKDTVAAKKAGATVSSEFFDRPFDENLLAVKNVLKKNRVQLRVLGVGIEPEMLTQFAKLVDSSEHFQPLKDAETFVKGLSKEFARSQKEHDESLSALKRAEDPNVSLSQLTDTELQHLKLINVDPEMLKAMRSELIQTGWFQPDVGKSASVCVYMRRAELEKWAIDLREQLLNFQDKQVDIFKGILSRHAGDGIKVNSIADLIEASKGVEYAPDIINLGNLNMEDQVKVRSLRKKLNNIEILLLTDKLFNKYEEGWVPIDYLPGSLEEFRKTGDEKDKAGGN